MSLGLVVSTAGSVALKLIFDASRNTGLNWEVTSMVFPLLVSCACAVATPRIPVKKTIVLNCIFIWKMMINRETSNVKRERVRDQAIFLTIFISQFLYQ